MKDIKFIDDTIANNENIKSVEELGINYTLFYAYLQSKKCGNATIDFNGVIWENDVEPIVDTLRKNGYTYITISSTFSSLINVLAKFQNMGCTIGNIVTVNAPYVDLRTNEFAKIPAIIVKL